MRLWASTVKCALVANSRMVGLGPLPLSVPIMKQGTAVDDRAERCRSGHIRDYRHWVQAGGRRLAHTMDPAYSGPLKETPASVSVLAKTCMEADAWATAFMVSGAKKGSIWSKEIGVAAVFVYRDGDGFRQTHSGWPY